MIGPRVQLSQLEPFLRSFQQEQMEKAALGVGDGGQGPQHLGGCRLVRRPVREQGQGRPRVQGLWFQMPLPPRGFTGKCPRTLPTTHLLPF